MEILELKITMIKRKINSIRMGETEVRVSELDDGAMEITLFEQHREKIDWKKENRVSGTCGTLIKDLSLISFQKEKGRIQEWKNTWRFNGWKSLHIAGAGSSTHVQVSEVWWTPNNKHQEIHAHNKIKHLEMKTKPKKSWKQLEKKWYITSRRKIISITGFLIRNLGG